MLNKLLCCFLLVFIVLSFDSCKKYPEGPLVSFRTRIARITGVWDVVYYSAEGIDSTSYIKSLSCYCYYHFYKDKWSSDSYAFRFENPNNVDCGAMGEWTTWEEFLNRPAMHTIIISRLYYFGGFIPSGVYGNSSTWDVLRLKNKELWLKEVLPNGKTYEMKLKKIAE